MRLFDARVCIGRDTRLAPFQSSDIDSLRAMLDKYRIARALLSSFASFRLDFGYGNRVGFEAAEHDERLVPCPTVLPDSGGEVGDEHEFIAGLVQRGARAVGFYPNSYGVNPGDWRVVGKLFAAIRERRLPVLVPGEEADLAAVGSLASEYPQIPFIYAGAPYRHRNLLPILADVPNLLLTIAPGFVPNRGIEEICRRFGPMRLLFASNYPVCEPGASIAYLLYAEVSDEEVERIAFGNMQRLIGEVVRE